MTSRNLGLYQREASPSVGGGQAIGDGHRRVKHSIKRQLFRNSLEIRLLPGPNPPKCRVENCGPIITSLTVPLEIITPHELGSMRTPRDPWATVNAIPREPVGALEAQIIRGPYPETPWSPHGSHETQPPEPPVPPEGAIRRKETSIINQHVSCMMYHVSCINHLLLFSSIIYQSSILNHQSPIINYLL